MSAEIHHCTVTEEHAKQRLDKWLAACIPAHSRAKIQQWILQGQVEQEGRRVEDASKKVLAGESYQLTVPPPEPSHLTPRADIPLRILYEDEHLMVLNKQAGLTVHPGAGNREHTLVHALLGLKEGELSTMGGLERPGIVHRLDKDTSGVMLVAKHDQAHALLSEALARREIKREYIALCHGALLPPVGMIRTHIGRSAVRRTMMAVVASGRGKEAITHYKTEAVFGTQDFSMLKLRLETGRTHQIRVHLYHRRVPIIGDVTYKLAGRNLSLRLPESVRQHVEHFPRQALHAASLTFTHPLTQQALTFEAPLPDDMEQLLHRLRDWV